MESNINILITGGYGFVGSHVYDYLKIRGYKNVFRFRSSEYDLEDPKATDAVVGHYTPDIIIHLAAKCGGIGANMRAPGAFWRDNLLMGINVLDAAKNYDAKVVFVGSTCSYQRDEKVPFKEENLFYGMPEETNAPYGIAKLSLLMGCLAYFKQYGVESTYLVPTNLFGPGDNMSLETSHVIPALIRKFHTAKDNGKNTVELWGDGSPTRDFLLVDDFVEVLEEALYFTGSPYPINVGTGAQVSIKELAEKIKTIVGFNGDIVWDISKPNGQPARALDITRAGRCLGWAPRFSLDYGLKKTYDWFVSNADRSVSSLV